MNVVDAMAEVETTIRRNPRLFSSHYYEVASVLAKEVERLRAELAEANAGLAMVEATVSENELLRVTNERLAADLAAAKAAEAVGCVDGCMIERAVKEFTEGMSNDY